MQDVKSRHSSASELCLTTNMAAKGICQQEELTSFMTTLASGKPENIIEKMVEGRVEKFYKEVCLLEQPFVKNPDVTIEQMITEKVAKIGEKISVRRFVRYEMGEGLTKRQDNFAEEVMGQMKK